MPINTLMSHQGVCGVGGGWAALAYARLIVDSSSYTICCELRNAVTPHVDIR